MKREKQNRSIKIQPLLPKACCGKKKGAMFTRLPYCKAA